MIKEQRQKRILEILRQHEVVSVQDLAAMFPECSTVTLRRDIAELSNAGAVRRTHGGAALPEITRSGDTRADRNAVPMARPAGGATAYVKSSEHASELDFDAVILPPIAGRGADALRRQVLRRGLPFIAESAPQEGGLYLGPDNEAAGRDLGRTAGKQLAESITDAHVLLITQEALANTKARAEGFESGLRSTFPGPVTVYWVNGQGDYKPSLRAASDALLANPHINVVFGVNDHSALAGRDAAKRHGRNLPVYAVGGERAEFVSQVAKGGALKAVAAFFPEVVGQRAIDIIAQCLSGVKPPDDAFTPHAIITSDNLSEYYVEDTDGWRLEADIRDRMIAATARTRALRPRGTIAFMPHYPAHDWYRVMIQSMQSRAAHYGLNLVIVPPVEGISRELTRLRRVIAAAAAEHIETGDTIIIGEGEIGVHLAREVRSITARPDNPVLDLTVITNSLDVLDRLSGAASVKVILTSGEYQAADRCLVGPSLEALFELMRADKAFLSVGGISARFGVTSVDERLALAGMRFARAAREVIAMADHTLVGWEANHRICRIEEADILVTDDGSPPQERLALRSAGIKLQLASDDPAKATADDAAPGPRRSGQHNRV